MQITIEAPAGLESLPPERRAKLEKDIRREAARIMLIDSLENGPKIEGVREEEQFRIIDAERQAVWAEQQKK